MRDSSGDHDPAAQQRNYDLAEVQAAAAAGRRLVIYDRATKLYAYWYLQLRGDEEIHRAQRYGKSFTMISLQADTQDVIDRMAAHLKDKLRDSDLAGYLNNGHFIVLALDTDRAGAEIALERVLAAVPDAGGVIVTFPEDGDSYDTLLDAAKARYLAQRAA